MIRRPPRSTLSPARRSSDLEEVFCRVLEPNARVPYTIRECSAYCDRRIPSLYFMEKTAWVLLTKKAGRTIGFVTSEEFRKMEGEDAEIVPTPSRSEERRVGKECRS